MGLPMKSVAPRNNANRGLSGGLLVANHLADRKAVEMGHLNVQQDYVRGSIFIALQRFFSVAGLDDVES
jgi:hypothetical protein